MELGIFIISFINLSDGFIFKCYLLMRPFTYDTTVMAIDKTNVT